MRFGKFLQFFVCGALAFFMACSSDDPASVPNGNSTQPNGGSGEGGNGGNGGSGEGGNGGNGGPSGNVSPVPLAATASKDNAASIYQNWRSFHYVTREAEAVYYTKLAGDFGVVFGNYSPVGRVIWSSQASQSDCKVENASVSNMVNRACTVSEGIGYGMLLSYFAGDDETFNSLWNYSRGERAYFKKALTPWETVSFHYRKVDASSATDADLDIATALILMNYRTGKQEYLDDAKTIINAIWDEEIQKNDLLILSGNTGMWTTDPTYNLSYFSPVAIRLFAKVDGNHNWNGVLDNMYTYMKKIQDAGTGVFPDWSDATGAAKNPPNGAAGKNENTYTWYRFDKESVRIPWRIAWDYYWFQDDRAKAILTTLNDFISKKSSGDPTNVNALGTSYTWSTDLGPDKAASGTIPSQWLGAWCATGIAGNKTWLDACTQEVNKKSVSNTVSSYFPDILLSMYSQLLNGAYLMPF